MVAVKKKATRKKATRKKTTKKVTKKATKKTTRKKVTKKTPKKAKLYKSKVCCSICKECKQTNTNRLKKLIGQFGSLEELHAKYVCRTCRKKENVRADGKPKPVKQRRVNRYKRDSEGKAQLPEWMKNYKVDREASTRPLTRQELKDSNTCWRPNIHTENKKIYKRPNGCCNGCPFFEDACGVEWRVIIEEKVKKVKRTPRKKK